jgi:hypothetical protein
MVVRAFAIGLRATALLAVLSTMLVACGGVDAAQPSRPWVWFGMTSGYPQGLCGRDPAFVMGYSVKIFRDGRVKTWKITQQLPIPQLTDRSVDRLVQLAERDGFFKLPDRFRDVSCRQAATTYISIRSAAAAHTVEIYGYLDSRHPAIRALLQALSLAINI